MILSAGSLPPRGVKVAHMLGHATIYLGMADILKKEDLRLCLQLKALKYFNLPENVSLMHCQNDA